MKILILSDAHSPHTTKWINAISKYGDVEICLIDLDLLHGKDGGINKLIRYILLYLKAFFYFIKFQPDIVHAHYVSSYGLVATLLPTKKIILSAWGSDVLTYKTRGLIYKKLLQFSLKRSHFTFADSQDLIENCNHLSPSKNKYQLINWGIQLENFSLSPQDFEEIRFISIRNFESIYNVSIIIEAFNQLSQKLAQKKFTLEIFGRGSLEPEIRKQIESSNFKNNIYLKGFVPLENVYESLAHSSCMITIPTTDGTASSLLEAMACGLFIIASNLPANKEWINDNNGLIIDSISTDALLIAMEKYLSISDNKKISAGKESREIISKRANQKSEFEKVINLYKAIIDN